MALLEIRDLKTVFRTAAGDVAAVDGVSLSVEAGTTLGIVGESGSGKTVTALSIMGLLPETAVVTGGSIRLEGEELVGAAEPVLRGMRGSRIGMVFQDPASSLNPVYRVGTQIAEAVRLRDAVVPSVAAEVELLLRRVEMPDPAGAARSFPHQLSGGMRQRATIAMALAREPELLIADEPTTALDVTVQAQILDLLARLRSERSMAMILITHDLGVVASIADAVVVMRQGQVVETGPVGRIFERPEHEYTMRLLEAMPRMEAR